MSPWHTTLDHQLEELTLIQCSLLPGEHFTFILPPSDLALWQSLLDNDGDSAGRRSASLTDPPCPARFEMRVEGAKIWFQVQLPSCSKAPHPTPAPSPTPRQLLEDASASTLLANTSMAVSVKGENVSRDEHEHWNAVIRERMAEIDDACEFPVYDLLTLLLSPLHDPSTPTLTPTTSTSTSAPAPTPTQLNHHVLFTSHHLISTTKRRLMQERMAEIDDACEFPVYDLLTLLLSPLHDQSTPTTSTSTSTSTSTPTPTQPNHHVLFTSHHLISTTKRRLMHQWSHDLNIAGFAKVGYPGIVYAEGPREAVEEFVGNVKGMQWLALRVRFQEPVSNPIGNSWNVDELARSERWVEVSKIGEVLEQMRKRGRETLVTSLGIGAPSKEPKQSSS